MTRMVKCPHCNGRGMIGFSTRTEHGNACFDFECDYCKGRCWVSKRRADKYEQARAERKGTEKGMGAIFKVAK